jgi:hypothetical protein
MGFAAFYPSYDNPGINFLPVSILIVDPEKSSPTGWQFPPRCFARNAARPHPRT